MPFKSKRQMRWMFAAEERGEVPKGTARRWAHETPNIKKLPEKKKEKKKGEHTKAATQSNHPGPGAIAGALLDKLRGPLDAMIKTKLNKALKLTAGQKLRWFGGGAAASVGIYGLGSYISNLNRQISQLTERLDQLTSSGPASPAATTPMSNTLLGTTLGGGALGALLGGVYSKSQNEQKKVDSMAVVLGGLTGLGAGYLLGTML